MFCRRFAMDPVFMSPAEVCMWIEYMSTKNISPATVRNKVSHARVFVPLAWGSLEGFNHLRVTKALDAVTHRKDYTMKKKDAVPASTLRAALPAMPKDDNGLMVRTAVLIMFYGTLRQLEVAPTCINKFDPLRHLTRADIVMGPNPAHSQSRQKPAKVQSTKDCYIIPHRRRDYMPGAPGQTGHGHHRGPPSHGPATGVHKQNDANAHFIP